MIDLVMAVMVATLSNDELSAPPERQVCIENRTAETIKAWEYIGDVLSPYDNQFVEPNGERCLVIPSHFMVIVGAGGKGGDGVALLPSPGVTSQTSPLGECWPKNVSGPVRFRVTKIGSKFRCAESA